MISHKHSTIFVHIPKNAGQSVEQVFLNDLGLSWEDRIVLLMGINTSPNIGPPRLAHLLARDYIEKSFISQELFDQYFKFAIVRNPWSRVYSFYKFLTKQRIEFNKFLKHRFYKDYFTSDKYSWFVRPQADYLFDDNDQLLVNYVGRFESIDEHFNHIKHKSCLSPGILLPNKNISKPKKLFNSLPFSLPASKAFSLPYTQVYNDYSIDLVSKLYEKDCSMFGYSFS